MVRAESKHARWCAVICVLIGVVAWSVGFFGWLVWPQLMAFKWSMVCYAVGYAALCGAASCRPCTDPRQSTGGWI